MFLVKQNNQITEEIENARNVMAWIRKNGYEFEPNVMVWGLVETIREFGEVFFYPSGVNTDYAAGTISREY